MDAVEVFIPEGLHLGVDIRDESQKAVKPLLEAGLFEPAGEERRKDRDQAEEMQQDADPQKRVELIDEINAMMNDYGPDENRTLFAQALQEAGLPKKTSGVMTVSELQRAKFAMRTVIARFES